MNVGIIGGADGPTSIFVSGFSLSALVLMALALLGAVAVAVALWLRRRGR